MALDAMEVLYEADGLPAYELPAELRDAYGGPLGFPEHRVFANFVSTLDGVVAIPGTVQSNKAIRAGSEADRFVMALLRACADVVVIGSGTLRGSPRTRWTPVHAYPPAAEALGELRRRRGQPPEPQLAVLTGRGSLDPAHPALLAGALVLTTDSGAAALRSSLPPASTVVNLGQGTRVDPGRALQALRERGHRLILSEAGPRAFGSLLAAGLVDELFLTTSPLIAGRPGHSTRLGLVEGADLVPGSRLPARLLSVRREAAHLLLRYEFPSPGSQPVG
ncbi:MAG: dihydrofolate reductase family protein [Mycobacteriales bacterium]